MQSPPPVGVLKTIYVRTMYITQQEFCTMRPKARGLAQLGRPPGWLEESNPGGCDFACDGRSMPPALTRLAPVHETSSWARSFFFLTHTLVDPCLLSAFTLCVCPDLEPTKLLHQTTQRQKPRRRSLILLFIQGYQIFRQDLKNKPAFAFPYFFYIGTIIYIL